MLSQPASGTATDWRPSLSAASFELARPTWFHPRSVSFSGATKAIFPTLLAASLLPPSEEPPESAGCDEQAARATARADTATSAPARVTARRERPRGTALYIAWESSPGVGTAAAGA